MFMHLCAHLFSNNIIQIIKAGTVGECMFFIASGSVCVSTANGQELCHLEDGDYFGEIAFILKNRKVSSHKFDKQRKIKIYNPKFTRKYFILPLQRIVNVMAIEFCEIYILDFANLKRHVQINETIKQKLTESANERMEATLKAEELFKKQLQEKINITRESFIDDA